jgi:uncharacterized protein
MTGIELIAVGVAAIVGGAVSALAGGGTLITFPVLLAVGVPSVAANVTNTVALCSGYLGGTLAELKDLSGAKRELYAFGVTSAAGGFTGGVLLLNTGEATFRALVPYLILLAAVLLVIEEPLHRWHRERASEFGFGKEWRRASRPKSLFIGENMQWRSPPRIPLQCRAARMAESCPLPILR